MDLDILPPSDDRVFKLILTSPDSKPALMDLISAIIGQPVKDVMVRNNELPPEDTEEKAERFDVNCVLDDGTQGGSQDAGEQDPGGHGRELSESQRQEHILFV